MPRTRPNLLTYVDRLYEQVFAPPFAMEGTGLTVLVLKANKKLLADLLNREVNGPWNEAFGRRGVLHRFVPLGGWLAIALLDVDRLAPDRRSDAGTRAPDALPALLRSGTKDADPMLLQMIAATGAKQRELIVMLPVVDAGPSSSTSPDTQRWYVPLVVNDLVPAILAGRELYGYPKIFGRFTADPLPVGQLFGRAPSWRLLTIEAYGPKRVTQGDDDHYELALLDVLRIANGQLAQRLLVRPNEGRLPGRRDWLRARTRHVCGALRAAVPSKPRGVARRGETPIGLANAPGANKEVEEEAIRKEAEAALTRNQLEYMFLRQFRDPAWGDRASYQAVVVGEIGPEPGKGLTTLKQVDWDPSTLVVSVPPTVTDTSLSILHALGIELDADRQVSPVAVFEASGVNLSVQRAEVVWDRP